ncbi:Hematopoietic SH2 domain-containing protein -like protein [Channa argus]|uniref:Hematopoietic SH2 domain-containing protein-like protein n=1 Tax=Channa argus TaxID=215402 RepID=A0A6G1PKX6_CHAAH|nr:Hematopoietic SH2 domain-containing protein -like protein [Channa argus]KAK2907840.1 hypothetical protein Q8A73_008913 [Channa argus]
MIECSQSLQGQHDVVTWFKQFQLQSVIRNGIVPEWFHGIISRKIAEELLMSKPPGYFLVRVSESRIGYTLSYRVVDRCRHFMIDVGEDGHYIIVGENRRHQCLHDLVEFHRRTPIMPFNEVLTVACGQSSNDETDYAELLLPRSHQNPNTSSLQNNSLQPNKSHPISQKDIPPALPYRPNNLLISTLLPASSRPNKLYPNLEDEIPHGTSLHPATTGPMNRKRYTAECPTFNQPPEVPARSFAMKQNQACVRTVSAPNTPSPVSEKPFGANIHPAAKNQEMKHSVISNLKKKFQKGRSTSQDNIYTEIGEETINRHGNTEYQEAASEHTLDGATFCCTDVTLMENALPLEYLPPPPFAPGY